LSQGRVSQLPTRKIQAVDVIEIRPLPEGEERETYELVLRTFHAHVAPLYSENGIAKFLGMISPDGLSDMRSGNDSFVIVAKEGHRMIGMLSVIQESHIALLFVDPEYQKGGVGKRLIDEAIGRCVSRNPEVSAMTVSSTPNARAFYEAVGFRATGDEVDEDGMRFVPMQKPLAD
jgi:ribosomal protein S18 acetylase RimI-like enzyme